MSEATKPDVLDGDAVAFRVDGTDHRWRDVFRHARRRGDWQVLAAEVRHALACLAAAAEHPSLPDGDAERELAVGFRRARQLHAAEDVEAWLAERALTVGQWRRWVRGETLRRHHAGELEEDVDRDAVTDEEVAATLPLWGWCSGALAAWARASARHAAAAHALVEQQGGAVPAPDDLDALAQLADRFATEVATDDRLTELVDQRHLDWLRLTCETALFEHRDAAAEAKLCIHDDGWSLEEVVQAAGARLRRHDTLVEEVDADVRHLFVRARDGDLLGPLAMPDGHALVRVLRKHTPSTADEEVRLRATRELVDRAVDHELADRVEWLHPR